MMWSLLFCGAWLRRRKGAPLRSGMDFRKTSKPDRGNPLPCIVTRLPKMGGFGKAQEKRHFFLH